DGGLGHGVDEVMRFSAREIDGGVIPDAAIEAGVPGAPNCFAVGNAFVMSMNLRWQIGPTQRRKTVAGDTNRAIADRPGQHDRVSLGGVAIGTGFDVGSLRTGLEIDPTNI